MTRRLWFLARLPLAAALDLVWTVAEAIDTRPRRLAEHHGGRMSAQPEHFGDLLALIDADPQPRNQDQSALIKAAILRDGRDHGGNVNPNRVRDELRDVTLFHKRVGPAYYSLKAAGLIEEAAPIRSTDTQGRNAGRWIASYRLTEAGWAA